MYNGNKIKELLAERNLTNKQLLAYLGVDCNSSITQLVNGNPTAAKLEKIADFFGVSIDVFFDRASYHASNEELNNELIYLREKVKLLNQLLEEKNKVIKLLEEKIDAQAQTIAVQA